MFRIISKITLYSVGISSAVFLLFEIGEHFSTPWIMDVSDVLGQGKGFWIILVSSVLISTLIHIAMPIWTYYRDPGTGVYTVHTFLADVVSQAAVNARLQILVSITPFALVISWNMISFGLSFLNIYVPSFGNLIGSITIALGWTLTGIVGVIWFHDHRDNWAKRMTAVSTMMERHDQKTHILLAQKLADCHNADLDVELNQLVYRAVLEVLRGLRDVLAYRLRADTKSASFLIVRRQIASGENASGDFVGIMLHDEPDVISSTLSLRRNESFAGQVLEQNDVLTIRDCRTPPDGIRWQNTGKACGYIGRAGAPVRIYIGETGEDIGVLCFDVKIPWTPMPEEEIVLKAAARRIAALWVLYQEPQEKQKLRKGDA